MSERAVRDLQAAISGRVVTSGEAEYDEARRVWNGMIDRRPLAVVKAASTNDVPAVIRYVREGELPLAIRGGGHNVAGNGTVDGGVVLDLGEISSVEVDEQSRTVRIGPGATLADVDRATEPHGLVVPIGVVSATGMAGLTLGGGFGWLTRSFGLTIDNLLAVELVTAAGEKLRASATESPELFWGVRGGGGNFGVVTSFTYRASQLGPEVFAGNLIYDLPRWRDALRAYADWTANLPDELTSIITFVIPPPDWELGSEVLMLVGFNWAGQDSGAGEGAVAAMRTAVPPDNEDVGQKRWVEWQSQADGLFPRGSRAYWKNVAFDDLEAAIETLIAHAAVMGPGSAADIHHMEGVFGRVAEDATAFPNRSARYWLNIYGFWADPALDEDRIAWVRGFHRAMEPHAAVGEYVNFLGNEGRGADPRALALLTYGPAKLERLMALKRRYDPSNLFRLNHNIPVA